MKTIEQLTADKAELVEKADAILAETKDEDGNITRDLTEDEAKEYDALVDQVKGVDAEIEKAQKAAEREEWVKAQRATATKSQGRKADKEQPGGDQPKVEPAIKAKRHGTLKAFKGTVDGKSADERAYRMGMWALASVSKQLPNRFSFPNAEKYVNDYIAKLHSEGTNTAGGYAVPEEFGTDLIDLREQYGVVRRIFKMRPMSSDTRTDPRRATGLTAYFVGEGDAATESTKSWDQVRLTAKDLVVLSRYTSQLSEDAVINIGDDLASEISYAFANKEDDCGLNGDGTSTYGGIVGVRQRLEDVNGVDDGGGIVLGAGNAYSELTLANFHSVVGRLPQYADSQNAVWVVHRTFYYDVMQKLELASGGTTASEIASGDRRPRPLFLGYPVEISQIMPSAAANSQVCALLGDFTKAASFGDRGGESISFSEHASVGGQSVFERNEIAIRGCERFDINVHDIGDATNAGPVVGLITASG